MTRKGICGKGQPSHTDIPGHIGSISVEMLRQQENMNFLNLQQNMYISYWLFRNLTHCLDKNSLEQVLKIYIMYKKSITNLREWKEFDLQS